MLASLGLGVDKKGMKRGKAPGVCKKCSNMAVDKNYGFCSEHRDSTLAHGSRQVIILVIALTDAPDR